MTILACVDQNESGNEDIHQAEVVWKPRHAERKNYIIFLPHILYAASPECGSRTSSQIALSCCCLFIYPSRPGSLIITNFDLEIWDLIYPRDRVKP
jgi:hypothetical protein